MMTWLVFIGLSCCEQGEDICVALQTHINDVMLRRYSRTRNVPNGHLANGVDAGGTTNAKPPGIEVYEKHVQEMSKLLEESQRKLDLASSGQSSHSSRFICVPSEWFGSVLTSQSLVSVLRSFLVSCLQLSEEIRSKEKRETQVLEELAGLRDSLRAEEQTRCEVSEERERLAKQLGDMDVALQVLHFHLHDVYCHNVICIQIFYSSCCRPDSNQLIL